MSDVQPYSPGATGTLADVVEQGPELRQLKPAGPDSFSATSGFGELFHANRVQNRAYRTDFDEIMLRDGYAPIVDALGLGQSENPAHFYAADPNTLAVTGDLGQPSQLATEAGQGEGLPFGSQRLASRQLQEQLLAARIQARRAKQPNFLPGVPDSVDGLHDYFRQQEEKNRQAASTTIGRGPGGLTQVVAGLGGGGTEAFHDPVNIATLALGGGGKTLLQVVGREALVNGVIEAVSLPQAAHNLGELGEHLTAGEAVQDVATSAAFGGLLGGGIHLGAAHLPPLLFKAMPESVKARWADRMKVGDGKAAPLLKDVLADMDNRELAGFARSTIGTRMTPDERAAADVIERSQELGEGSPFAPGPAGDAAHNANLGATFKAVVDGDPTTSPKADRRGSSSPIALRPIAVPRHAGFDAQWSAIKGNEHGIGSHGEFLTSPKGAIGPAQVMPGTAPYAAKLAGVPFDEQRYRTDAAYNEHLGRAYYAEQLQTFGDPAMAAAAYNAGPGSAARGTGLRGALRKAVEHGEPGNWEAYLPHETQRYVADFRRRTGAVDNGVDRAIDTGAGDDEIAGLQRSADDAEAEAIAVSRVRGPADDLADRSSIEDVPVLKRELFGSDNEWSDAQAAFHQSLNAPEEAAGAPLSGETGSGPPDAARADGSASGTAQRADPITVASYVDAYMGGEGRGDSPRDRELLQFASNNGREIEAEFGRRAAAADPSRPLTMPELEAIGRPANAKLDPLWYAGLNAVHQREIGKEPQALWALRDKGTGEVVSWGVKRAQVEAEKAKHWTPDHLELQRLHPENVAAELRERAVDQAARARAADIRLDEPALKAFDDGGSGRGEQVDSLEHDARLAADDPELGKRTYTLTESGKPQTVGEILEALDRERDAVAALRSCAGGA